jgi:hypothetical protein
MKGEGAANAFHTCLGVMTPRSGGFLLGRGLRRLLNSRLRPFAHQPIECCKVRELLFPISGPRLSNIPLGCYSCKLNYVAPQFRDADQRDPDKSASLVATGPKVPCLPCIVAYYLDIIRLLLICYILHKNYIRTSIY